MLEERTQPRNTIYTVHGVFSYMILFNFEYLTLFIDSLLQVRAPAAEQLFGPHERGGDARPDRHLGCRRTVAAVREWRILAELWRRRGPCDPGTIDQSSNAPPLMLCIV